jgi:DNA polymerase III subunit chi
MAEVWFYHLETQPLDRVLPVLLQRSLDRGWRCCVQATSEDRVRALDTTLWTYDEASFLPHGIAADGNAERQPILLTDDDENPNGAVIRFFVEGAEVLPALAKSPYERAVLLFDGADEEALQAARRQWTALKQAGHSATYWQQTEDGRWEKRG